MHYKKIVLGIFILLSIIAFIYFYLLPQLGLWQTPPPHLLDRNAQIIYPSDLAQDTNLLGASHNVFVGKVLAQIGNKETEIGPRTQYLVEVITNIKGSLSGTVVVDQFGGYKDGRLVSIDGFNESDLLFSPGITYLIATRYNENENWHTLISHPNGRKVLSDDMNATIDDLRSITNSDEKVKSLEAAYPDEVLLDADIAHQNTRNEFKSLPADKKAAAQSRADSAKASLDAAQQPKSAVQ